VNSGVSLEHGSRYVDLSIPFHISEQTAKATILPLLSENQSRDKKRNGKHLVISATVSPPTTVGHIYGSQHSLLLSLSMVSELFVN